MTVYDENSRYTQCIWVIGGRECGNCIHCYNIPNNRLIEWDTLIYDGECR